MENTRLVEAFHIQLERTEVVRNSFVADQGSEVWASPAVRLVGWSGHGWRSQGKERATSEMYRFLIVIEQANGNYSAYSPDLPGCVATGKSRDEATRNMYEAIEMHVRGPL